jgi:hypothetical protein
VLTYRQLAILSKAADIKDPAKYKVWLDGKNYDEAVFGQVAPAQTQALQTAANPTATSAPQTAANNPTTAAQTQVPTAQTQTSAATPAQSPAATVAAGKVAVNYNLANADKILSHNGYLAYASLIASTMRV